MAGEIDKVADLVAASATFQTLVGAGNEAAARLKVYTRMWPAAATVPFAIVGFNPDENHRQHAKVATGTILPNGTLTVDVLKDFDETAADDGDAQLDAFDATVLAIIDEMELVAGTGGRLFVRNIEPQGVTHNDPDDYENTVIPSDMTGRMIVNWGLEG